MSASTVSGRVVAGGRSQPGATVLALRGGNVLDSAITGGDGAFALAVAEPATLLAKARSQALGLACSPVSPGEADVTLEVGPLHSVTVEARGEVPNGFDLQLSPRALADLSAEQVALMHVPVDGMSDSMLATRPLSGTEPLELAIQEGTWLLYAALESAPDALGADMERRAWRVERAMLASGEPLAAGPIGHLLEVRADVTVVLEVVEVPTE